MRSRNKFVTCDAVEHAIRTNLDTHHVDILNAIERVKVIKYDVLMHVNKKRIVIDLVISGNLLNLDVYIPHEDPRPFFYWHLK